ncbi:MAG: trypsin-like peptidase domain-containing protein [Clostridia bacterium]|nr:trypsin-like peptidase domain-containing protein [Clostridia bacterium]
MRKYPHTQITDLVLYEAKAKKSKKPRIWLACLSSALVASIFTGGLVGSGMYLMNSNKAKMQMNTVNGLNSANNSGVVEYITNKNEESSDGRTVLSVTEIAQKVGPSVVGVINKTTVQPRRMLDPFSGRYYYYDDPSTDENQLIEQGSGSGIIITSGGYVVTNEHVISGATEISVILNSGEELAATLVGSDEKTDIAILKVETDKELTAATLGDSSEVEVGELAVAIGNPLGQEFAGSVTAGVISAVNRTMTIDNRTYNLLQTDAAINSGNSGGALINKYGEVVGINSVKLSQTGVEGLGFAIAISEVKPIINDLMSTGYVKGRPLVGITVAETRYGLFVSGVTEGTGAEKAGLLEGDMIVKVDGETVKTSSELNEIRDKKKPGDKLKFSIFRDGESIELNIELMDSADFQEKE